jgi:hypothetical protein
MYLLKFRILSCFVASTSLQNGTMLTLHIYQLRGGS